MTLAELRKRTAPWRRAHQREQELRAVRDSLILEALAAGLTQRDIAEAVGVSYGRVGQLASNGSINRIAQKNRSGK